MVIPRSRSAFSLSSTHAYLNEPLPNSAASYKRAISTENEHQKNTMIVMDNVLCESEGND